MGIFNKTSELMKKYELEKGSLGSGNFAVVKKCWPKGQKAGPFYAVKIIDKSKVEDMGDIEREIEIMGLVDHPNVIKLIEIFDESKKMNLVMELVTGGELFDRIVSLGNYTEKDAAVVMSTLCNALDYLHQKGIVHRDLKPENILLENDSKDAPIKVADFGLARMISGKDMMKTACGTPGYVAPEVLQNKGYSSGAVDLWSAGVILYILLCGFPPFYEEELPALFDQILKGRCVRRRKGPAAPRGRAQGRAFPSPRKSSPGRLAPPVDPSLSLFRRRSAALLLTCVARPPHVLFGWQVRFPFAVVGYHLNVRQGSRAQAAHRRSQEAVRPPPRPSNTL